VYAFLYALVHFLIFVALDYNLNPSLIYDAIVDKKYALIGFGAFCILLPLALTSTKGWQKRLGKNWKSLHRWAYVAGIFAVIHYIWLVKSDIRKPLVYAALISLFLLARTAPAKRLFSVIRSKIRSG
jgi:sulfoxide reductase heme-binding subunit YedZ